MTALLQGVAAAVGALGLIADEVRERGLGQLAREVGLLGNPVPER
jgi:hypothetical protein